MPFNVDDPWTRADTLRDLCEPPCDPNDPEDPDQHNDNCPALGFIEVN